MVVVKKYFHNDKCGEYLFCFFRVFCKKANFLSCILAFLCIFEFHQIMTRVMSEFVIRIFYMQRRLIVINGTVFQTLCISFAHNN